MKFVLLLSTFFSLSVQAQPLLRKEQPAVHITVKFIKYSPVKTTTARGTRFVWSHSLRESGRRSIDNPCHIVVSARYLSWIMNAHAISVIYDHGTTSGGRFVYDVPNEKHDTVTIEDIVCQTKKWL